jgi:hypothetical protein
MLNGTRLLRRRTVIVPLAAALVLVVGGGIAYANIPDGGKVIHGCYKDLSGSLRGIDTEAGESCSNSETALPWNQSGPAGATGAQGPTGATGATGPTGPSGAASTRTAAVTGSGTLEAGSATSATRTDTGHYTVTFPSDMGGCFGVAAPGSWHGGNSALTAVGTVHVPSVGASVDVRFNVSGVGFVDTDFMLILAC